MKLNPIGAVVKGKKVIVVDDSIVRGTTAKQIIKLLNQAGAKEVHLRIGSPQVKYPCFYGIDTPIRKDLFAQKFSFSEMKTFLCCNSIDFLSIKNMINAMSTVNINSPKKKSLKIKGFVFLVLMENTRTMILS